MSIANGAVPFLSFSSVTSCEPTVASPPSSRRTMDLRIPCAPFPCKPRAFTGHAPRVPSRVCCVAGASQPQAEPIDPAPCSSPSTPTHMVTVHDRRRGLVHQFRVPEDQYILHTAEAQDISLPFACRHGCCTSCAVRVKSGKLRQPAALGISTELKSKGYALLCVSFPSSDIEVETQDEDEVYWLQFGRYFARGPVERDDYALELALGDE